MPTNQTNKGKNSLTKKAPVITATDISKFEISKEFYEIVQTLVSVQITIKHVGFSVKWYELIKPTEASMKRLFDYVVDSQEEKFDNVVALAQAYVLIALIYMEDTRNMEKLYVAQTYFMQSMMLLRYKELDRKAILIVLKALTELSHLLFLLDRPQQTLLLYDKSLELYFMYTKEKIEYPAPLNVLNLWNYCGNITLDILCIKNLLNLLYYTVFRDSNAKSSQIDKNGAMAYAHKLLSKCFKEIPSVIEHIDWAMLSAQLSVYFRKDNHFTEARSHLIAASFVIEKFYDEEYVKVDGEGLSKKKEAMLEEYNKAIAKISIHWVKYGISLFRSSKERLLQSKKDNLYETDDSESKSMIQSEERRTELLIFADLEKDARFAITDKYILNYNDAKAVFTSIMTHLNKAKACNTSQNYTIYMEIVRNISITYKYLTNYAHDEDTIIKLHKERIKTLEDMLKQFNTNHVVCKHIWFELAISYSNLLDIKIGKIHLSDELSTVISPEINELVKSGTHFFQLYLNRTT